jgi:hypothetical protein
LQLSIAARQVSAPFDWQLLIAVTHPGVAFSIDATVDAARGEWLFVEAAIFA